MPYAVFIIKASGDIVKTMQPKAPEYPQLKAAVSGLIQTVPYFTKYDWNGEVYNRGTAYCNEKGLILGLPYNQKASFLWGVACPKGDPSRMRLHGDVIFFAKQPNASDRKTIASGDKSPKEQREV